MATRSARRAALLAAAVVVGGLAGYGIGSGGARHSVTVFSRQTVARTLVVTATHQRAASDGRDSGVGLDLRRVAARRRDGVLEITIQAWRPWNDRLLRGTRRITLLYDVDLDGRADDSEDVLFFRGRLIDWVTAIGDQGVQGGTVVRRGPATIVVTRPVDVLYAEPDRAPLKGTAPLQVAVVARTAGARDRVPDDGWILVPAPRR